MLVLKYYSTKMFRRYIHFHIEVHLALSSSTRQRIVDFLYRAVLHRRLKAVMASYVATVYGTQRRRQEEAVTRSMSQPDRVFNAFRLPCSEAVFRKERALS